MNAAESAGATGHLDDATCADLVLGLAPEPQRVAALAHARECAPCEARLRAHVSASERAAADAPRAGAIVRPAVPLWRRGGTLALVAAALAVAIALPLLRPHAVAPRTSALLLDPGELVRTREAGSDDAHLAAGLAAYRARDLATAERELSAARPLGPAEQVRRLYLAQVRFARGDAAGALPLLRSLDWFHVPEPWRRGGVELLARTLRAVGEGTSADSLERALRDTPPGTPIVP